jgi:hypothetical protein
VQRAAEFCKAFKLGGPASELTGFPDTGHSRVAPSGRKLPFNGDLQSSGSSRAISGNSQGQNACPKADAHTTGFSALVNRTRGLDRLSWRQVVTIPRVKNCFADILQP